MPAHTTPKTDRSNRSSEVSNLRILTELILVAVSCLAIVAGLIMLVQFWLTLSSDTQGWSIVGTVGLIWFTMEMAVLVKLDRQKGR